LVLNILNFLNFIILIDLNVNTFFAYARAFEIFPHWVALIECIVTDMILIILAVFLVAIFIGACVV
jgi:hypothetical protein